MKKLFFLFSFTIGSVLVSAQDCTPTNTDQAQSERAQIPGQTMGQKLESLLFWTQEEKLRRFSMMHEIFPSIPVEKGQTIPLKTSKPITPQWQDDTTLESYLKNNHIQGVLALQDNAIILEKYADGVDNKTLWTSFSVAKSISSLLLGVAIEDGAIESLDDKLKQYIPEFDGYDYGEVTVRQLLTMTSGIDWNEDYEDPNSDVGQMYQAPCHGNESHIITYMKPLKSKYQPGTHWNYSTGETDLVGILIQKANKKSLSEYLSEKIWKPFGMEHCAYWLADECSNLNLGGSGLNATLRDYGRLGLLMLNKGKLHNESLVSTQYMANSTSLLQEINDSGDGYGYLWWRFQDGSYAAVGIFGQMLYINPHKNLVIAQMAAWPKAGSKELSQGRQEFINAILTSVNQ